MLIIIKITHILIKTILATINMRQQIRTKSVITYKRLQKTTNNKTISFFSFVIPLYLKLTYNKTNKLLRWRSSTSISCGIFYLTNSITIGTIKIIHNRYSRVMIKLVTYIFRSN